MIILQATTSVTRNGVERARQCSESVHVTYRVLIFPTHFQQHPFQTGAVALYLRLRQRFLWRTTLLQAGEKEYISEQQDQEK
jgi:hypothetical protein